MLSVQDPPLTYAREEWTQLITRAINRSTELGNQSLCRSRGVGAVGLCEGRIVLEAKNGQTRDGRPCGSGPLQHNNCVHAEERLIDTMKETDVWITTIACNFLFCPSCATKVAETGVRKLVFKSPYHDLGGIAIGIRSGIEMWNLGPFGLARIPTDLVAATYIQERFNNKVKSWSEFIAQNHDVRLRFDHVRLLDWIVYMAQHELKLKRLREMEWRLSVNHFPRLSWALLETQATISREKSILKNGMNMRVIR